MCTTHTHRIRILHVYFIVIAFIKINAVSNCYRYAALAPASSEERSVLFLINGEVFLFFFCKYENVTCFKTWEKQCESLENISKNIIKTIIVAGNGILYLILVSICLKTVYNCAMWQYSCLTFQKRTYGNFINEIIIGNNLVLCVCGKRYVIVQKIAFST